MPDSTEATLAHRRRVQKLMAEATNFLSESAATHDQSKLEEPEKSTFDWAQPRLKHLKIGDDGYERARTHMGEALEHHYAHNRHHPEHHDDGIYGMDIFDLLEMLTDWKAAGERQDPPGTLEASLAYCQKRYGFDDRMADLLRRTAARLGWLENPDAP